jgi:hypothetical protein
LQGRAQERLVRDGAVITHNKTVDRWPGADGIWQRN